MVTDKEEPQVSTSQCLETECCFQGKTALEGRIQSRGLRWTLGYAVGPGVVTRPEEEEVGAWTRRRELQKQMDTAPLEMEEVAVDAERGEK